MIIFGDQGSGKTLCLTALAKYYENKNYDILANFHLLKTKYKFIDSTYFNKFDFYGKQCVLVDEIGIVTSTRNIHAISLTTLLAQSRKRIGEKYGHLIMAAQSALQTNNDIRAMVDYLAFPEIKRDFNDIPFYGILRIHKKFPNSNQFFYCKNWIIDFENILGFYKTDEIIEPIKDGSLMKFKDKYKEYLGETKRRKELALILRHHEGLGKSESEDMAYSIILGI